MCSRVVIWLTNWHNLALNWKTKSWLGPKTISNFTSILNFIFICFNFIRLININYIHEKRSFKYLSRSEMSYMSRNEWSSLDAKCTVNKNGEYLLYISWLVQINRQNMKWFTWIRTTFWKSPTVIDFDIYVTRHYLIWYNII